MQKVYSIEKLPEVLINQIKAGEVVERPASVVKELVENSIDAEATSISVELLDGGKQLIRIIDNGVGIEAKSLPLALERHATSKLKKFSDLEKIASFGFRGEALPSIASVSEFIIKSKPKDQNIGRELIVSQGKIISEKDCSLNQGTMIQAKDLFNNVPARLKFLKSTSTEYSHIYDFILAISFYYYSISFRLNHNGRDIFHYKQKESSLKRFEEILGSEASHYAPVRFERGSFHLSGFSLLPEKATSLPQHFITFVNGRLVKDKIIRAGVLQAYQGLLLKGLLPSAIIFIEIDPSWMDVNVHPAKIEVRFADPLAVQELIAMGIQDSIKQAIHKSNLSPRPFKENNSYRPNYATPDTRVIPDARVIPAKAGIHLTKTPHLLQMKTNADSFAPRLNVVPGLRRDDTTFAQDDTTFARDDTITETTEIQTLFAEPDPNAFENAKYLGQFSNCYLILEKETQLWFLDQHAFHERILFEEYITEYTQHPVSKQSLLTPTIIPATESISTFAQEHKEKINELGFEIEILTNSNIALHTYPAFLSPNKIQSTLEELLHKIIQEEHVTQIQFYHLFYSTLACHNAVRAGDPLNAELVQRLLQRSNHVDFFAHCPHGRPVLRKFEKKDVESWFLRI